MLEKKGLCFKRASVGPENRLQGYLFPQTLTALIFPGVLSGPGELLLDATAARI